MICLMLPSHLMCQKRVRLVLIRLTHSLLQELRLRLDNIEEKISRTSRKMDILAKLLVSHNLSFANRVPDSASARRPSARFTRHRHAAGGVGGGGGGLLRDTSDELDATHNQESGMNQEIPRTVNRTAGECKLSGVLSVAQ